MRMWMKPLALAGILTVGLAACEEGITDTSAVDDDAVKADIALMAADAMFQDLIHMQGPTVWMGMANGPDATGIQIEGSKSFSRTVTFFDKDGVEQDKYDAELTASMHIESELEREVTHTFWSADIERERDMWVTGLFGDESERTWNGDSEAEVEKSRHPDGGVVRTYDMETSAVIEDVVRGVPRKDHPYPLSGTITRKVYAVITKDGVEEIRDFTAIIEFDGDNTATMTVDGETWEINLDDRGVNKRFKNKT